MTTYLILSIVAFLLCCAVPELLRLDKLDATEEPISTYLTGPYHLIECAGFAALAAAMIILAFGPLAGAARQLALAVALGVVGAMVTDTWAVLVGPDARHWHLASAGLAFVAFFALELVASHGWALWLLTAAYPIGVGLLYWWRPSATAWQEKAAVAIIAAWLCTFAVTL